MAASINANLVNNSMQHEHVRGLTYRGTASGKFCRETSKALWALMHARANLLSKPRVCF